MEISEWITTADPDDVNKSTPPFAFLKKPQSPLLLLTTYHPHQQQQEQQQQQQQQLQLQLQREARFVCVISSPLGSSHITVVQNHELEVAQDGTAVSIVRYSEAGCCKGLPMMRGDISVKTTFEVTPAEGDPESIRVRVGVAVGEVPLSRAPRWLKARVANIVRADGVKQAKDWLEEMTAAEERGELM